MYFPFTDGALVNASCRRLISIKSTNTKFRKSAVLFRSKNRSNIIGSPQSECGGTGGRKKKPDAELIFWKFERNNWLIFILCLQRNWLDCSRRCPLWLSAIRFQTFWHILRDFISFPLASPKTAIASWTFCARQLNPLGLSEPFHYFESPLFIICPANRNPRPRRINPCHLSFKKMCVHAPCFV